MRTRLLILGCVVLLGGAWFISRSLVDEPVPAASPVPAGEVDVVRPTALELAPPPPPQRLSGEKLEAVINSQVAAPMQPDLKPLPTMKEAPPPVDVAPSPFQGESRELDYAEELILEPVRDEARLLSALEVMKRCLDQEPQNARCQEGLKRVQLRLYPPAASELPPPAPTLQVVPPNTLQKRP